MQNEFNDKTKNVYFLDKDCELKIVLTTMPHKQIFVRNEKGIFKISKDYPFIRKDGRKRKKV